jgi:hypothetical protein
MDFESLSNCEDNKSGKIKFNTVSVRKFNSKKALQIIMRYYKVCCKIGRKEIEKKKKSGNFNISESESSSEQMFSEDNSEDGLNSNDDLNDDPLYSNLEFEKGENSHNLGRRKVYKKYYYSVVSSPPTLESFMDSECNEDNSRKCNSPNNNGKYSDYMEFEIFKQNLGSFTFLIFI